jgi:hypothetical protein
MIRQRRFRAKTFRNQALMSRKSDMIPADDLNAGNDE